MSQKLKTAQTRETILISALTLFSEQGLGETSLRAVGKSAGVNDASIHYHFGSKDMLVRSAYKYCFEPINQERSQLLEELTANSNGSPQEVSDLITVMYWPVFKRFAGRKGRSKTARQGLSMIAQMRTSPEPKFRNIIKWQKEKNVELLKKELQKSLPDISTDVLWKRMAFVNSVAWDSLAHPFVTDFSDSELKRFFDEFVHFSAAGMAVNS